MVSAHDRGIRLSAFNSGATLYPNAPERGMRTFQTIEDYRFAERIRSHTPQAPLPRRGNRFYPALFKAGITDRLIGASAGFAPGSTLKSSSSAAERAASGLAVNSA
jgi:hypothetical protein